MKDVPWLISRCKPQTIFLRYRNGTIVYDACNLATMERYILIDHTADVMVKAFGDSLEECFGNAAFALFDQTVDLSTIGTSETIDIRVSGIDDEDRLDSFPSEMLFLEDADGLILKEFDVSFDGEDVICTARGETLDLSRHRIKSEVKAITYHMMEIDLDIPSVTVLFDV